jgi:hypothetical protein
VVSSVAASAADAVMTEKLPNTPQSIRTAKKSDMSFLKFIIRNLLYAL